MAKNLFHCVDETIDLSRVAIVSDVSKQRDPGGSAYAYFYVYLQGIKDGRRYLLKEDDGCRSIVETHTALLAAWADEDGLDLEDG